MSATFVCRVGTPEGRIVTESLRAENEASARAEIESRGGHIFEIRRRGLPISLSLPSLRWRRRMNDQEFLIFNQELAGLLRAGLPLLQALDLMIERQADTGFLSLLTEIRERVKGGEELSEAFANFEDRFPALYISTLKAGERSGELEQVIRRFIRYLKLVMQAKRRVSSALVYPAVLIGLSMTMLGVMTIYVIPKFETFYISMDIDELPWLTQLILDFSEVLQVVFALRWLPLWLIAFALAPYLVRRFGLYRSLRLWIDRAKLRLPLVGTILWRFSLSEFSRSLGTLLSGGMPLVPALEVAVEAIGNLYLRTRLRPLVAVVREGGAFHQALEDSGVFPDLGIDLVKVGEATGSLDEMLGNVSDFFDEEVESRLDRLLSLVEPIMLVIMGLLVALLLAAMYLPLFSVLGRLS